MRGGLTTPFPRRALRVRKKMSGEKMPVKMIGDILTAQLPHMQPYIRFCSCQLNGAALIQQKTDEAPDFKDFVKVRSRPTDGGGPARGAAPATAGCVGVTQRLPARVSEGHGDRGPG